MHGELNPGALHKAIQTLVDRHEALRTTFSADGDYQSISPRMQIDLPLLDISHVDERQQEVLFSTWFENEIRQPFDFERGPLLRCYLLKKGEHDHLLVLMYHHIAVDGWSISVLLQELSKLYTAEYQQRNCQLPQPGRFSEYAQWEKRRQQGPAMAEAERYWQAQFATPVPHLELPSDRPRQPFKTFVGAQKRVTIDKNLALQLKSLSVQRRCTLYVTLLTAFQILLYRLSSQEDFVVGIPTAGQPMQGERGQPLVGHCINLLPLRSRLQKDLTFAEHMNTTRNVLLDAHDHNVYPFLRLIQALNLQRETGSSPLFNVLFNFDRPSDTQEKLQFAQLEVDGMTNAVKSSKYDLTLELLEADGEILADFTYSTDLFDTQTVERWSMSFLMLLKSVAADSEQYVSLLPLLPDEERTELLLVRNDTRTDYARNACVHHLFEEQVARTPEAVAAEYLEERLTYRELNERANQLAHYLQKQGVKPGVCVAICMERSLEMLVGLLGIFKAGGAFLPLDPTFPQERMIFMCVDAQVSTLLTQEKLIAHLPADNLHVLCLDTDWERVAQERTIQPESTVTGAHLAYVMYTSGSTGKPKGVLIPHQGICNYLIWCAEAYGAVHGLGAPVQSSIAADAIFPSLFAPLLVGTRVVMLPESQSLESLNDALRYRGGFSMIKITPTQLEVLNHQLPEMDASGWVRTLVVGAEALRGDILHFWQEHADGTILLNEYGPTETVVGCSIYHIPDDRLSTGPVPIGLPIANIEFYVLDAQMQLQPVGVPGELYIGGDGVAWGYLNRPELTAAAFVPHPFSQEPGARLYKTGDLVRYLPDRAANIEFLGRIDQQVKIKGYRVELGEVEAALAEHETVEQVVVLAREDMAGAKQLAAYVVPAHGTTLQLNELRSFLQQKLPDYMLPAAFVLLDRLPLTATGKVDTRALPTPERVHSAVNKEFVDPQTAVEKQVAEIWSEVLHLNKIGLHDNFFELRGDSLLATQVVARIRKTFHVELTLRHFFGIPTVAGLAADIEQARQQAQGDDEKIADFLKKVRQLSDQEISNMLAR
jgi:amino acid adenylation domain-containing protein